MFLSALTALVCTAFLLRPRKNRPTNPTSHAPVDLQNAPQSTEPPKDDTNIISAKKIDPRAKWKAYNPLDPHSDPEGLVHFKSRLACHVYLKQVSALRKNREVLLSHRDQLRNDLAQIHTELKSTNAHLDNVNYKLSDVPRNDGLSKDKLKDKVVVKRGVRS